MKYWGYLIEFIVSFFIIWGLNFGFNKLLELRLSPIIASVFSFVIIGFMGFLLSSYIYIFPYPEFIYFPIAIFFFLYTLVKNLKKLS